MTPFAMYLEKIRRNRNLQQKQLADMLGINPSYLSNLESGRKAPPSPSVISEISKSLALSEDEQAELHHAAEISELNFQLPSYMSADEFEFVYALRRKLGSLTPNQVLIMHKTLELVDQRISGTQFGRP